MKTLITITLAALLIACGCGVEKLPVTVKVDAPLLVELTLQKPASTPEPVISAPIVPEPLPPKKEDVTEISIETDKPMPD